MYIYNSKQSHFTSNPKNGEPYGMLKEVVIDNGRGFKMHANLNEQGNPVNPTRHGLTKTELGKIRNKQFVQRLWHCCKTRKNRRSGGSSASKTRKRNATPL